MKRTRELVNFPSNSVSNHCKTDIFELWTFNRTKKLSTRHRDGFWELGDMFLTYNRSIRSIKSIKNTSRFMRDENIINSCRPKLNTTGF